MDSANVIEGLQVGEAEERAVAYAVLESSDDTALMLAALAPLADLLCRPVAEVGPAEFQRINLLTGVGRDDPTIMGKWIGEKHYTNAWCSPGNALDVAMAKPADRLTQEDMLVVASTQSHWVASLLRGFDPLLSAGSVNDFADLSAPIGAHHPCAHGNMPHDAKAIQLVTLSLDFLADSSQLTLLRACVWALIPDVAGMTSQLRPTVLLQAVQGGIVKAMVADARSGKDLLAYDDPVVGRARTAAIWGVAGCAYCASNEIRALAAETPGITEFLVDVLRAYEAMESPSTASVSGVYHSTLLFSTLLDYLPSAETGGAIETLRGEASALRFLLDNPVVYLRDMSLTTNLTMVPIVAKLFGRLEDSAFEFDQHQIDDMFAWPLGQFEGQQDGRSSQMSIIHPIDMNFLTGFRDLCVSDKHKTLLLNNRKTFRLMQYGLFLDPKNPRGPNAVPPATPTPPDLQAICQLTCTEALQQLALYDSGREAILCDATVMKSLEGVMEHGLTKEAQELASVALLALSDKELVSADGQKHIMLSYQWSHQGIIKRINASLLRRNYSTWFDLTDMKGSTMDAMSLAVEGAAVFLFGVSLAYKESGNCRLECQYAMQQDEVEMIPLLMEEGCKHRVPPVHPTVIHRLMHRFNEVLPGLFADKAKGWLGLLMGSRMYGSRWYAMWDADKDDPATFEGRVDNVCKEIGERGKMLLSEAVPPEPASAPATMASAALTESVPTGSLAQEPASLTAGSPTPTPAPAPAHQTSTKEPALTCADCGTVEPPSPQRRLRTRAATTVDTTPLETQLLEQLVDEAQTERAEMRAEIKQLREALKQSDFHESELVAPTDTQLSALQKRLEGCHAQQLLKDNELWAFEDLLADFVEIHAVVGVITKEILLAFEPAAKLHKLLALSEKIQTDRAFARQAQRKFLHS